ncbi:hypothetical protein CAEBREN_22600 [Caenorhabditis brenneri]|uniref:Uncharacterized protein n=1 Tax=Caenorhabditis brenneri TaxID=135651 RepID=G0P0L3_CAEBE|nr:hypothetical protein CAEBREN_22600 [Caenorhabditis brenneri]
MLEIYLMTVLATVGEVVRQAVIEEAWGYIKMMTLVSRSLCRNVKEEAVKEEPICSSNTRKCGTLSKKKEKKTEQKKRVKASISTLKVTLEEKEQELEKKKKKLVGRNRSLMIEIEEEVDDIKVLKEVMKMKEMEKEKWNEDLKAARKDCNATSLHMYKLSKKLNELHAKRVEKRDRKEEGEAGNDESK